MTRFNLLTSGSSTIMRFSAIAAACAVLSVAAPQAAASQTDGRAEVEVAAARHIAARLREKNPDLRIALDGKRVAGKRLPSLVRDSTLQAMRAVEGSEDSLIVCGSSFSTCRMRAVDAIVSLKLDAVTDTTALVIVTVKEATGLSRVPIQSTVRTFLFTRQGKAWIFARQVGRTFTT